MTRLLILSNHDRPPRRGTFTLLVLGALLLASLSIGAASALAYTPRSYESQLRTELFSPLSVATDSAQNVWVGDGAPASEERVLSKFDSSNERLAPHIGTQSLGENGSRINSSAVDLTSDDLYLAEPFADSVHVFDSNGLPLYQIGSLEEFGNDELAVAVDNSGGSTNRRVYVAHAEERPGEGGGGVDLFGPTGTAIPFTGLASYIEGNELTGTPEGRFGTESYRDRLFLADTNSGEIVVSDEAQNVVDLFHSSGLFDLKITGTPEGPFGQVRDVTSDPTNGNILVVDSEKNAVDEFDAEGHFLGAIDGSNTPAGSFSFGLTGIAVSPTGRLYIADSFHHVVDIYSPSVHLAEVEYRGVSNGNSEKTAAALNATIYPAGGGAIESCKFEYVAEADYHAGAGNPFSSGATAPCEPPTPYSGSAKTEVMGGISNLSPGATYRFRIVVRDSNGITQGRDERFTLKAPVIESFSAKNLAATTADLVAQINPEGGETTYHFEYGTTTAYGSSAPVPDADMGSLGLSQAVVTSISGLQNGHTYHFQIVAQNSYGTAISEDQTFNFFPPSCPNAHLRQITNSSYLPDCRAYELVSPGDAGGTTLFPEGPNSASATNPSRFAFGGFLGTIPNAGDPPNNLGDLYVATRTSEGWITKYVGIPADRAVQVNGPPDEPNAHGNILASPAGVRGNGSMSEFLDWNDGDQGFSGISFGSFTPNVWNYAGESLGTWPTASGYTASPIFEQSADFSHHVFQTGSVPSLSLVDEDTTHHTAQVVSILPGGGGPIPIQTDDGNPNVESLRPAALSSDGSHILIAARSTEPAVSAPAGESCGTAGEFESVCPLQPSHLYMRVNDEITYDVSQSADASYVGMTPDGSTVYFTSPHALTPNDQDTSVDLYRWSEPKPESGEGTLTLISGGSGAGNSDTCAAAWVSKCDVGPYSNQAYYFPFAEGAIGGNGHSDNSIAASNGNIYFFSPEQLVGSKGEVGQENLYLFRENALQYVTTVSPQPFCIHEESLNYCSEGPIIRMQVTPSDSRMAFLTASPVTAYNSGGHTEMYTYTPSSSVLKCVSCLPSGEAPTSNVTASSNGTFMTNDGRVVFGTGDPLVPQDTDRVRDVYEYVEGRAQLISSGTSVKDSTAGLAIGLNAELFTSGLVGVSGDGTNVYFSTYDSLVGQDRNGDQLKFYDARTDGGFPFAPPPALCQAADECHGAGSLPPEAPRNASGADLGGTGSAHPRHGVKKKHKSAKKHKGTKRHRGKHRDAKKKAQKNSLTVEVAK